MATLVNEGFQFTNLVMKKSSCDLTSAEFKFRMLEEIHTRHFQIETYFDSEPQGIDPARSLGITANLVFL